ncbi:Hypothetical protein PHPALM_1008 [Phytophthora palmivora]|uniref:TKL protein kinase n=1 Tax=Phytophthora palmivora TaxID=4796 RepID=A0A2P4YTD2_9STRA|nr:Hypothetical protein PHPALM_1008 [Phytophthora palmivora]
MGSCGDINALIKTTVHRPDDECHTNYDRTQSTRLLFRDSLMIVKYDDPECTILSSEMVVTWEDALYGLCVGGNTTVFYQNYGSPDLTAVTVFEDNECSEKPVKITFTMWFGKCNASKDPGNSVCAPHGSSYHSVSCTPYYYDFASTTFSSNPYLLVAEFAGKSCTRLQSVVAYIADGSCQTNTDDTTSFMAIISEKSSASITTYIDSSCNIIDETTLINKRQLTETWFWSCYGSTSCNAGQSLCNKRFVFGGLSGSRSYGLMTAVVTYGTDSSCSQRAKKVSFTLELMCNSQSNNWNVVCEDIEGQHYVSYCTRYWSEGYDGFGLLDKAFGWPTAYLLVEEYDDSLGYCGDEYVLYNAVAYLLDEECQTNRDGKTSSQLMVGHSVTITKFADPLCTVITSQTEVSFRSARRRSCISSSRFTFRGPIPDLTAVAVFDDSLCSSNPVKLTFSQDFVCSAPQYPEKTTCGVDGTTLYSVSSCTSGHSGLTNEIFDTPYINVEEFWDSWCGGIERVAVYVADGACHTNTDDTTSFRATIRSEGSATIITYSDPACMSVDDDVKFTIQNSNWCTPYTNECNDEDGYGCSKRFSVGGLGGQPSNGRMNSISDCTDYHRGGPYDWFLERYLGYNPNMYVLLEVYDESCAFDFNLNNATAYLLDEECHSHSGTKSTKLSLGLSLTITEFDDPNCNEISIVREVPFMAAKNYDCVDDQVIAYLRGGIPDLTVKAIFADSACSGAPTKLAFAQYFKCEKPTTASCEQVSVNHFSVSDCTRDYVGVIANSFGSQNPYVIGVVKCKT